VHSLVQAAQGDGYELYAVSVPKTIDNDLPHTDHCPGYGSAARFMAMATMDSTVNLLAVPSTHPIKIIEAMGRDVGWLTAASALGKHEDADPPHLLLVPEQSFNEERFLQQVKAIYSHLGHAIIVTAEDIRDEQGQPVNAAKQQEADAAQSQPANSTAQCLANLIRQRLQLHARFERYGDLQWCSISSTDRDEAYLVGQEGTRALLRGETDKMITLIRDPAPPYRCITGLVELAQVVGQKRLLPDEFLDAGKTMVTQAFYNYALPLLGDPLPVYPKLEDIKVRV
jgi:6-phosphofructokinase 1